MGTFNVQLARNQRYPQAMQDIYISVAKCQCPHVYQEFRLKSFERNLLRRCKVGCLCSQYDRPLVENYQKKYNSVVASKSNLSRNPRCLIYGCCALDRLTRNHVRW